MKLLIVDDEKSVRDRLCGIDWASQGVDEVMVATHGLEGLQLVYDRHPDVILSDINMPVMNGIEMIRQVRARFPWIEVIVLSGYDDFDYIRECMRSQVVDYILKPINEQELLETFQKVKTKLGNKNTEEYRAEAARFEKQKIVTGLRRRFLRHYFSEKLTEEEIEENAAYAELDLDSDCFGVMCFRLDLDGETAREVYGEELRLIVFALDNIIGEYLEEKDNVCGRVDPDNAECVLLLCDKIGEGEAEEFCEGIKDAVYQVAQLFNTTMSCAVGGFVADKTQILTSLKSARELLNKNREHDAFLYSQDPDEIIEEVNLPAEEAPEMEKPASEMKLITRSAIEYIDQNFTRPITLDDVADHVYLSPTYVSYLFRTEVKINFINYLTQKRMEKAKELLKNPRMKIYEISASVGYENSRYFSSIFKKYVGVTPIDYRSGLGLSEHL